MKREIVKIDEEKCDGCGICVPNCHEGALQIIDGKARLVSELRCDGLGACLGHCPQGAITIEEREAEPYDEIAVIKEMLDQGENTLVAHLKHLKQHGEKEFLNQAVDYLWDHEQELPFAVSSIVEKVHGLAPKGDLMKKAMETSHPKNGSACSTPGGCPGQQSLGFDEMPATEEPVQKKVESALSHWPVQMHLINPNASYFQGADLLLSADCVAYALGSFHQQYLKGKKLAIACPKLDVSKEVYLEKLMMLINQAHINTLTVMKMEVPCCGGLLGLAQQAVQMASRKIPVKAITVSIQGEILEEEWEK